MPANGRYCIKCDYFEVAYGSDIFGWCNLHPAFKECEEGDWCGQFKPDTAAKEAKTTTKASKKESYGKYVRMLPEEYDKLVAAHGHKKINDTIQSMDAWCNKPGNSYTDFYLAVCNWLKREVEKVQGPIY